jgi:uncharacterized membrane protein
MTAKRYKIYRIFIAAALGAIFSASIVAGNFVVPIISLATSVGLILMLKRNVKEVLEDERDYEIGGRAARYALGIYSYLMLIVIFMLFLGRANNPGFETIASILAYSVCGLVILFSFIFKYLQSDSPLNKNRTVLVFLGILAALFLVIFNIRLFSAEDGWICQDGQWVEHGDPDSPKPDKPCVK